MHVLNVFEQALLLYAKRRYIYNGDRIEGARILAAHIAGIPAAEVRNRDIARWLVSLLVWIDKTAPRSVNGGLRVALEDCFEHLDPSNPLYGLRERPDYWTAVVEALLGQVTITRVMDGDQPLFEMPAEDAEIQSFLDMIRDTAALQAAAHETTQQMATAS